MKKQIILVVSLFVFLIVGGLLIQKNFAGYSTSAVNLAQNQIYKEFGVNVKMLGEDTPVIMMHDKAILFNQGDSLRIGSMISHDYYFVMEVTESKSPLSFSRNYKHVIEKNTIRIKNTDVIITYSFIVNSRDFPLSPWIYFQYHIGTKNYFGRLTQTEALIYKDKYWFGDKMIQGEKELIEGMIADLI